MERYTGDGSADQNIAKFQPGMYEFLDKEETHILVDYREVGSGVVNKLSELNPHIDIINLSIGDYVISSKVCIERKTAEDFISSIIDRGKRDIFKQSEELSETYERPTLIIEGDFDWKRDIHPSCIKGAILKISIKYGISILYTKNPKDTACTLNSIATQEHKEGSRPPRMHAKKPTTSTKKMQEYIVSSLPMVGPKTAKKLLKEFGSISSIFNASKKKLESVDGIGEKKANKIAKLTKSEYTG